ncbi:MAG: hypothetical protein KFH98_14520, partial [Gemmatimonadetes bacterium]|nr:hypothetical protein [Gemmatimonadota bacterium]
MIAHAEWESTPPLGHAANADRRNLKRGDQFQFLDLTVGVIRTVFDSAVGDGTTDFVRLRLMRGSESVAVRTVREGAAFNWSGYHIAIVAVYGP